MSTGPKLLEAINLTKFYRRSASLLSSLRKSSPAAEENGVAACSDISLTLRAGEVLGIVGRNGSGKSTLLRLLAGITLPSSGTVTSNGRVVSMIELGAGFDMHATGFENAHFSACLQGLERGEVDEIMADIEAFADIGEFFRRPVRTYSSGMFARVAFATIVHCRPDVLLIDEVLAVGDEAFQRKCFARLRQLVDGGCAVAFVSHSSQLITELCDRAILLDHGRLVSQSDPKHVINQYYRLLNLIRGAADSDDDAGAQAETDEGELFDPSLVPTTTTRYPEHGARIGEAFIVDSTGRRVNHLRPGHEYEFRYTVDVHESTQHVEPACLFKTLSGVELAGVVVDQSENLQEVPADTSLQVQIPFVCAFAPGTYFCNAGVRALRDGTMVYLHRVLDIAMFKVLDDPAAAFTGLVDVRSKRAASTYVGGGHA